ncbi:glycosyltransferase [Microbacterium sp. NPDC057961]|uniref:glycosyltransferase n=1 Tax=Microbacterium sp. NPDC057961 TaxID=3346289 RepID=UPI0036DE5E56
MVTAGVTARLFMRGYAMFLAQAGYEVTLVANDVSDISRALAEAGVAAFSLPMRRDPSPMQDVRSLGRMISLMRRIRPDAVIYATPKASLLASIAARLVRVPVRIYELWGIRFETASGAARRIFRGIEQTIAASSTAILANSASLADQAIRLGITKAGRIEVPASGSSHGVDSGHFSPAAPRPALDVDTARFLEQYAGTTIGYIGRLHPDKGVETLLEAAALVREDGLEVRVVLVGGDEGLDIRNERRFPVHRTGEAGDVRPYLAEFDILVLMSLREGFPNVVLEAAAMEVPAIVSDATGCVDSVIPGVTGVVVPVGDVAGLREALKAVATDPTWARQMGIAARGRAVEAFEPRVVWAALEQHLRAQLNRVGERKNYRG